MTAPSEQRGTLLDRLDGLLQTLTASRRHEVLSDLRVDRERWDTFMQRRLYKALPEMRGMWGQLIDRRIDRLLDEREEPLYLDLLGVEDWWFEGLEDDLKLAEGIIRAFSREFGIVHLSGRAAIASVDQSEYERIVRKIVAYFTSMQDSRLTKTEVELSVWAMMADRGVAELAHQVTGDHAGLFHYDASEERVLIAVGDTIPALIKAAFNDLEQPAHYKKITSACSHRKGQKVKEGSVLATLSKLPEAERTAPGMYRWVADEGADK